MRKLSLRVAKQFTPSLMSSSWQHSNLNQDSLSSKSIVLNEGAIGRIDLPRSLVTSDHSPESPAPHPSRNGSWPYHTANAMVYISTLLPSEHLSPSPGGWRTVCCVSFPGWSISLSVSSPPSPSLFHSSRRCSKELLHQPESLMSWTGPQPTCSGQWSMSKK